MYINGKSTRKTYAINGTKIKIVVAGGAVMVRREPPEGCGCCQCSSPRRGQWLYRCSLSISLLTVLKCTVMFTSFYLPSMQQFKKWKQKYKREVGEFLWMSHTQTHRDVCYLLLCDTLLTHPNLAVQNNNILLLLLLLWFCALTSLGRTRAELLEIASSLRGGLLRGVPVGVGAD